MKLATPRWWYDRDRRSGHVAKALLTLAADTSLRQLYAERGLIRAKDFNTAHIAKQWIEVIEG